MLMFNDVHIYIYMLYVLYVCVYVCGFFREWLRLCLYDLYVFTCMLLLLLQLF